MSGKLPALFNFAISISVARWIIIKYVERILASVKPFFTSFCLFFFVLFSYFVLETSAF